MRGNTLSDAGTIHGVKGTIKGAIKGAKGTGVIKKWTFFTQELRGQCADSDKAPCIRIDLLILLSDTDALFVKLKQIIYK